ncbi:PilZ domain-containing protein [Roseibium sp. AS2]|uniref:PilZ domain-containing protein n=1 Tax=Roseibium sp. AS2 TaxID=3135781 RepID=UPI0031790392
MSTTAAAMNADNRIAAQVFDLADMSFFDATAYDVCETGCRIATDRIDLLKEEVGLRLAGFDELVRGRVVACGDRDAQISFHLKQVEPGEKRRETRRPVWITAVVSGRKQPTTMKCRIVDASKSGCRLEGDTVGRLPEAIEIAIPGMDQPISGSIVWWKDNQAGVRLSWPFKAGPKPTKESLAKRPGEDKQPVSGPKVKKKISAFGG